MGPIPKRMMQDRRRTQAAEAFIQSEVWEMGSDAAWLWEEDVFHELGFGACGATTKDGSECGFPLDEYGSCGVESRHG